MKNHWVKTLTPMEAFPCPFCGRQPKMQPWHNAKDGRWIACDIEDEFEICAVAPNVVDNGKKRTLSKWNTRP